MKNIFIYTKVVFIIICLTLIFTISFSKDSNKTISKSEKTSSNIKIKDNNDSTEEEVNDDTNKETDTGDEEEINDKSEETENNTPEETEDTTVTITEDDIKLENLNSDNELSGLYSSNSSLFNTSIPFKNSKDTLEYYDYYKVSDPKYNIKKSTDIKIYTLDRMYCTGFDENSIKETQMIFIENGNILVSGFFKGKIQKIKILGIKVPDYKKKYRPTHFKEYYLKEYHSKENHFEKINSDNQKDKKKSKELDTGKKYKLSNHFDSLAINGFNLIEKENINNMISYKDYHKRRIVKHLDTILRKHTVFLAFDNIVQEKNGNLTAYFYLKNYHCLNKSLIEEGFANLDPTISLDSKTKLYFFDEFLKSMNIAIKTRKGIHFSKKEKIRK